MTSSILMATLLAVGTAAGTWALYTMVGLIARARREQLLARRMGMFESMVENRRRAELVEAINDLHALRSTPASGVQFFVRHRAPSDHDLDSLSALATTPYGRSLLAQADHDAITDWQDFYEAYHQEVNSQPFIYDPQPGCDPEAREIYTPPTDPVPEPRLRLTGQDRTR